MGVAKHTYDATYLEDKDLDLEIDMNADKALVYTSISMVCLNGWEAFSPEEVQKSG